MQISVFHDQVEEPDAFLMRLERRPPPAQDATNGRVCFVIDAVSGGRVDVRDELECDCDSVSDGSCFGIEGVVTERVVGVGHPWVLSGSVDAASGARVVKRERPTQAGQLAGVQLVSTCMATIQALRRGHVILIFVLIAFVAAAPAAARGSVEVVITLKQPSLAQAAKHDRALASVTMHKGNLDLRAPSSLSYIQLVHREQDAVAARIASAIPGAYVHWRYAITLNGLAVVVPPGTLAALARVPGVARVWPSATFHASLDRTPQLIGAPILWGQTLATAGQGMKIGIIDEGVDKTHPFLSPTGFTMPAGYPLGNTSYTTA